MTSNWKEGIECSHVTAAHWVMVYYQGKLSWKDYLAKFGQTLDGIFSLNECWAVDSAHAFMMNTRYYSMRNGASWKDYIATFDKKLELKLLEINGKSFI